MCGLAGVVSFAGARPAAETLERMGAALGHRGPDAQGLLVDDGGTPHAALVHRRLSIIDLREVANQPLADESGRVHVLLNGEIYNFPALRTELIERGHAFRTRGDTEVILRGYLEWGEDVVDRLDGMFALALWDARARTLLLARDPFGKKPLYYWSDGARFVFGSEIKALLAAGVPAELAAENLPEYLAFGYTPTPRTLFRGIWKLPPASVLTVSPRGAGQPRTYWGLLFPPAVAESPNTWEEAIRRVRVLLAAAVQKRLLADVPLGVLLSGGVDSSAVAALVAQLQPGRVKTFCIGFEDEAFYDERGPAAVVARHIGSEHHEAVVRPRAAELLETLLAHHDEPFGDSSALPTYLVAREARRHVTVALNGDGGDELFAGYDRFQAALLAARLPGPLLRAMRVAAALLPAGGEFHSPWRRLRRFADHAALGEAERLAAWGSIFDLAEVAALLGADGEGVAAQVTSSHRAALSANAGATPLARALAVNAATYLPDDLLPKMDRMSMAHGLETRSPLLDRALAEYTAVLPDRYKRRGRKGKLVLKRAVADLLPPAILRRRKQGFGVPVGEWFRGELRPLVEDVLLARPRLAARLRADRVRRLWTEHLARRADHGHRLWTLLTLELWMGRHRFE